MEKIKKSFLSVASIFLLAIITAVGIWIVTLRLYDISRPLITAAIGFFAIAVTAFVKEKIIHKTALPVYLISSAIMILSFVSDDKCDLMWGYIPIGSLAIAVWMFLPLTFIEPAKRIGRYRSIKADTLIELMFIMAIPIVIICIQPDLTYAAIAFLVCLITLIVMKKENRISLPYYSFLIPIAFIVVIIAFAYYGNEYAHLQLETILSRGKNDPTGMGFERQVMDSAFASARLIGKGDCVFEGIDCFERMAYLNNYSLMLPLCEYGWLAFIGIILLFALFFVCIFKMVSKINQSSFAKYTALMLALYMLLKSVFCLLGLFVLDFPKIDMPFFDFEYSYFEGFLDYFYFGIIFSLYVNREKESVIKEEETDENSNYLLRKIVKKIKAAAESYADETPLDD